MRELTLDDAFWRDALAALRRRDGALASLEEGWPEYAGLVRELTDATGGEPCLVGGRSATAGKNPRLFLLLLAATLAREGIETLYLDLSSELRWLEMLIGEDLKEGLVDHLQYEVPLDRCVRSTALPGLSVLTGGAYFLAGSPLADAPAFRAALESLRGRHEAVVVAFAHPFDEAESAGVTALCDAWIAIEEGEVEARLTGSERAVVQLAGDPQAAWDLARLSSAFVGPIPALLASGTGPAAPTGAGPVEASRRAVPESRKPGAEARSPGAEDAEPETEDREPDGEPPVEDEEEVAFLRAFEGAGPSPAPRERVVPFGGWGDDPDEPEAAAAKPAGGAAGGTRSGSDELRERLARGASPSSRRIGRGGTIAVVAVAAVVILLGVGFLADLFDPLWAGSGEEPEWAIDVDEAAADDGDGTMVALDAPGDSGAPVEDAAGTAEAETPALEGEPTPYSLHVGSYQSPESGGRVVRRLEEIGQAAFLAPVDLGEKGRWYRVYAGAFADSASADRTLDAVLGRDVVEEGAVRHTPWAFRLGAFPTREAAEERVAGLASDGISAYAVGDGPSVVWAGAFRSEDEAAAMAGMLEEAGVEAELTERQRPR